MKTFKIILLLTTIAIFTSVPSSANAIGKDCSHLKLLSHKWNMCKAGSDKYDLEGSTASTSEKKEKKEKKERKSKVDTSGWTWLEKIRNFGGEKVGEKD